MQAPASPHYSAALSLVTELRSRGYQAFFAGGCVRDMILGGGNQGDIDIATDATPETIARLFPQVIPVGEQFGVMIVVRGGIPFEVATFRSDIGIGDGRRPDHVVYTDAKTDALRRDFTVNGMFYDPLTETVIDYVGGEHDIQRKIIRAIGDPQARFQEDYLRLLRAIRFAARLEFQIDPPTWQSIHEYRQGITKVSPERVFQEIDKMLVGPGPDRALDLLHESGLLAIVLPEVEQTVGVEQPPQFHPEGDVFTHTLRALSLLEHPDRITAWSVLLHDIGKPPTKTVSDRIRFNNHDQVGAALAQALLRRLRAPNALIDSVVACVANHMGFMNVRNMRLSTLKRFLSRPTLDAELELHRVDCLASHGDLDNYYFLKEQFVSLHIDQIKPVPLLRGRDLIELGMRPGPLFGRILDAAYDLQLEEQLQTHDEAILWVKREVLPDPQAWAERQPMAAAVPVGKSQSPLSSGK